MTSERISKPALAWMFVLALAAGGCATSTRAPGIEKSGFMGADFALLKPGPEGHAQLAYVRPGVNWPAYNFVLLDPVTVWKGKESAGKGISAADEQTLVNYFYSVIRDALEKQGFTIVNAPGPDTLRVKVAITKPEESNVTLNVVSTVIPALHMASSLDKLATGKPAFVGEAQVEVKATDALTGELLAAGIDHRVGGKALDASMMTSWGDVEAMMRLWASHGSYNLCRLQNRASCIAPKQQQ
jgi:hypothetical protein